MTGQSGGEDDLPHPCKGHKTGVVLIVKEGGGAINTGAAIKLRLRVTVIWGGEFCGLRDRGWSQAPGSAEAVHPGVDADPVELATPVQRTERPQEIAGFNTVRISPTSLLPSPSEVGNSPRQERTRA